MPMASNSPTMAAAPNSFELPASRNMPASAICTVQRAICPMRPWWTGDVWVSDGASDMSYLLIVRNLTIGPKFFEARASIVFGNAFPSGAARVQAQGAQQSAGVALLRDRQPCHRLLKSFNVSRKHLIDQCPALGSQLA